MFGIYGKKTKFLAASCAVWLKASVCAAAGKTFLVLGVIASAESGQGVALLKGVEGGEAFAARVGQEIALDVKILRITREFVYLQVNGRMEKVHVGEQVDTANLGVADEASGGIERSGNNVRISASFREHAVKNQLGKILMQAAAVPYYLNGELVGFRLWDIDQGSIYERTGFVDGDIVTSINGQALTDVGMTIRMLQSLKDAPKVDVNFIRNGESQEMQILVQ